MASSWSRCLGRGTRRVRRLKNRHFNSLDIDGARPLFRTRAEFPEVHLVTFAQVGEIRPVGKVRTVKEIVSTSGAGNKPKSTVDGGLDRSGHVFSSLSAKLKWIGRRHQQHASASLGIFFSQPGQRCQ